MLISRFCGEGVPAIDFAHVYLTGSKAQNNLAAVSAPDRATNRHGRPPGRLAQRRPALAQRRHRREGRSRAELKDRCRFETRYYISSAVLCATRAAEAVRAHWAIENSLHWVLDVIFGDDQSRLRTGHGAKNMAVVRHFAINLARAVKDKQSVRLRRKCAGWDINYLATILGHLPR